MSGFVALNYRGRNQWKTKVNHHHHLSSHTSKSGSESDPESSIRIIFINKGDDHKMASYLGPQGWMM